MRSRRAAALRFHVAALLALVAPGCAPEPVPPIPPVNEGPAEAAVSFEPAIAEVNGTVVLTASAIDPDGDDLAFDWSAPVGPLDPRSGPIVSWTAPAEPGSYRINVTIVDPDGLSTTAAAFVPVVNELPLDPSNRPPEILSMTALPEYILENETATVTVRAIDPGRSGARHDPCSPPLDTSPPSARTRPPPGDDRMTAAALSLEQRLDAGFRVRARTAGTWDATCAAAGGWSTG